MIEICATAGVAELPIERFDEGVLHRQLSAWPLNFVARFSTADPMAEVISLTFLAPTMNTWAPS
jgi:hypothetical protein